MCSAIAQPTQRREKQSTTTARYSLPSQVATSDRSATQSRFGSAGSKSRRTRSGAVAIPGTETVVRPLRRRTMPDSPAARISRATRASARAWPTVREIGLSGHAYGWLPPITSERTRSGACSPIPKQSLPPHDLPTKWARSIPSMSRIATASATRSGVA
jgi:hypothetical protein